MFNNKKLKYWSNSYWNHINRNIGIITIDEQEKLRKTSITIFGTGGMGGPLAEQLVRSGFEHIVICDNDKFEESNLNRQSCTRDDLGKYKVDVIEDLIKKINPNVQIKKFYEVNASNISQILEDVEIVTLLLDDPLASILISRACLERGIPMLESWCIPYLWAWWFTPDNIDYETCYGFDTHNLSINEMKKLDKNEQNLKNQFFKTLLNFPNIRNRFDREKHTVEGMLTGKLTLRSFAPIVRITASYIAIEVIFSGILKIKKMILAPNVIAYDYFDMKLFDFSL